MVSFAFLDWYFPLGVLMWTGIVILRQLAFHEVEAVMAARESLHAKGFVAINGKTLQGKACLLSKCSASAVHLAY